MIIQHNISAMGANRNLGFNGVQLSKSQEKLSSGYAINRAGDDAAGLSISEKMRSQIRGLDRAVKNAQDGISYIQTAEGALTEVHDMLQRMRELATQGANGTNSTDDTGYIAAEMTELQTEITRVSTDTEFNKRKLFTGGAAVSLFVGVRDGQSISINALGALPSGSTTAASTVLGSIDADITTISSIRSDLGAKQNRLEHTINNLSVTSENVQAAESRVRDTDMASEMLKYTRSNVLAQASQSMLAQANSRPQQVLQLLQ